MRASEAKATRPGSYGSDTSTSVRPASASSSVHSAPVRSSKPYAKTGSPCHASSSDCEPLGRAAAKEVAVPEPEPVELGAVGGVQPREVAVEVARVEQPLSSSPSVGERVGEAAGRAERDEPFSEAPASSAPDDQRALGVGRDAAARPGRRGRARANRSSKVPIVAAEEAAERAEQVALDAVDVRRVRHDQCRFVGEARQIALEQERHLARVGRPCQQGESHLPIVGSPRTVRRRKRRKDR